MIYQEIRTAITLHLIGQDVQPTSHQWRSRSFDAALDLAAQGDHVLDPNLIRDAVDVVVESVLAHRDPGQPPGCLAPRSTRTFYHGRPLELPSEGSVSPLELIMEIDK